MIEFYLILITPHYIDTGYIQQGFILLLMNCLDRQPLLDALPACGSENCIVLLTDLMRNKELEEEQAHAFLTTIALIPHPSPQIIHSINVGTSG